ncbi:abortive infection Abi-like protein [Kribbella antiqua]|uniref:Abortive infection Abi-like protein n=1 Tax=Kribbella antiqua TaxID=2512217 RepID=A0A4R2I9E6_9ACTN|nr:abortive infection family protein [Kribbella antiqua]TCO41034.1 abortive infection Abi-like protein [Kribbella antiqua]
MKHLGLHPEDAEAAGGDGVEARALKRLFGGLSNVLQGAGELRNRRGAGHGRSGAPLVDDALARLTAGLVMSAVVYLCEIYEDRLAASAPSADGPALPVPAMEGQFVVGSIVQHQTFGEGQLISLRATDSGPVIEVVFDHHGRKKLLLRQASLRLVRNPPGF